MSEIDFATLGARIAQTRPAGLALLNAGLAVAELARVLEGRGEPSADLAAVAIVLREAAAHAASADAALARYFAAQLAANIAATETAGKGASDPYQPRD